ncbi:MAG: lamin tail domain-containing protein, partial [Myxococcota bacterium]|nr:lamin tail domain-containing protein [Myxococcota bacterium]
MRIRQLARCIARTALAAAMLTACASAPEGPEADAGAAEVGDVQADTAAERVEPLMDVEAPEVEETTVEDAEVEETTVEEATVEDAEVEEPPKLFRINELMAVSDAPLVEGSEQRPDWIEIANISGGSLDIGGWYVSDDPDDLTRWQLPERTLPADGLLLVAASDRPVEGFDEALRAPFSLKAAGEFLALVAPDGETIHQGFASDFPEQRFGVSYGIDPETG